MSMIAILCTAIALALLALLHWASAPEFWQRFDATTRHGD